MPTTTTSESPRPSAAPLTARYYPNDGYAQDGYYDQGQGYQGDEYYEGQYYDQQAPQGYGHQGYAHRPSSNRTDPPVARGAGATTPRRIPKPSATSP
jgi:hypothetical protein